MPEFKRAVSQALFGEPDHFTTTYWIYAYAMIILVFSTVYNVNAIIPRETAENTPEFYERVVQLFHVALILLGIALLGWQLAMPLKARVKHGKLERRKPKIFPGHVLVLAWILTISAIIFLVWKIIFEIIFLAYVPCDGATKIPSLPDDPNDSYQFGRERQRNRVTMIVSDFFYMFVFAIFLLMQCAYVHVWSKYKVPEDMHPVSFPLNSMHIIIVNLAIYVRMTLVEAKETFEHEEKYKPSLGYDDEAAVEGGSELQAQAHRFHRQADHNAAHQSVDTTSEHHAHGGRGEEGGHGGSGHSEAHHHGGDWLCNGSLLEPPSLKNYFQMANRNIVEPFGFALTIECILTLGLFVHGILHHINQERLHGPEAHGDEADGHEEAPKKTRIVAFMGQHMRVKNKFKKEENLAYVWPLSLPKKLKFLGLLNLVTSWIITALSVCFCVTFFLYFLEYYEWARYSSATGAARTQETIANATKHFHKFERNVEIYLGSEMFASLFLLVVMLSAIFLQVRKRPIPEHALQDIKLLMYSMVGEVALGFFIFLACIFHKRQPYIQDWEKYTGWFAGKSILDILVCIIQALFISRCLGYKTYTDRKLWLLEAVSLGSIIAYNFCFWIIDVYGRKFTFRANFFASNFYDHPTWSIVNEVAYPIGIFFRFHSLVLSVSMFGMLLKDLQRKMAIDEDARAAIKSSRSVADSGATHGKRAFGGGDHAQAEVKL